MSKLQNIKNSINKILKNKCVNRPLALVRYCLWQLIKIFNIFPRYVLISNSHILIPDERIALEGGTKLFTQGMYDCNNMNMIKQILKLESLNFFDIGANIIVPKAGSTDIIAISNIMRS